MPIIPFKALKEIPVDTFMFYDHAYYLFMGCTGDHRSYLYLQSQKDI